MFPPSKYPLETREFACMRLIPSVFSPLFKISPAKFRVYVCVSNSVIFLQGMIVLTVEPGCSKGLFRRSYGAESHSCSQGTSLVSKLVLQRYI